MPNPEEIARIDGPDGETFDDWDSVWVQHEWGSDSPLFRFTCAERDPLPKLWTKLQLLPGDNVTIYLAGQLGITGAILDRQVAYDANNHSVMLIGNGKTWYAAQSSVDSKTREFDNKSLEEIARAVFARFHVALAPNIGKVDPTPFPKMQAAAGELAWDFIERLARIRGAILSNDQHGHFVLVGTHNYFPKLGSLIEGINILKCQALISKRNMRSKYNVEGSNSGSDQQYGKAANEIVGTAPGSASAESLLITPAEEILSGPAEAMKRAAYEARWREGTLVQVHITTTGWLRPGTGDIWRVGDQVHVRSPMIVMNQPLKIKTATFTQDSRAGTLTTLELWLPEGLNDKGGKFDPTGATQAAPSRFQLLVPLDE